MFYIKRLKGRNISIGLSQQWIKDGVEGISRWVVSLCHFFCADTEEYVNGMMSRDSTRASEVIQSNDDLVEQDIEAMQNILDVLMSHSDEYMAAFNGNKVEIESRVEEFDILRNQHDDVDEDRKREIIIDAINVGSELIKTFGYFVLLWGISGNNQRDNGKESVCFKFHRAVEYFLNGFSCVVGNGSLHEGRSVSTRLPPPNHPGWESAIEKINQMQEWKKQLERMDGNRIQMINGLRQKLKDYYNWLNLPNDPYGKKPYHLFIDPKWIKLQIARLMYPFPGTEFTWEEEAQDWRPTFHDQLDF